MRPLQARPVVEAADQESVVVGVYATCLAAAEMHECGAVEVEDQDRYELSWRTHPAHAESSCTLSGQLPLLHKIQRRAGQSYAFKVWRLHDDGAASDDCSEELWLAEGVAGGAGYLHRSGFLHRRVHKIADVNADAPPEAKPKSAHALLLMGDLLFVGCGNEVRRYQLGTASATGCVSEAGQRFEGHTGYVSCLATLQYSIDSRVDGGATQQALRPLLLSGSYDCSVRVWDMASGRQRLMVAVRWQSRNGQSHNGQSHNGQSHNGTTVRRREGATARSRHGIMVSRRHGVTA